MKEVIERPFFLRVCCDQTPPTAFEPHQSSDPLLYISNAHKLLQKGCSSHKRISVHKIIKSAIALC